MRDPRKGLKERVLPCKYSQLLLSTGVTILLRYYHKCFAWLKLESTRKHFAIYSMQSNVS